MDSRIESAVRQYGGDILRSPRMQLEKQFFQHGQVTVFAHSFAVACLCLYLVRRLHIRADQRHWSAGPCSTTTFSMTGTVPTPLTAFTAFTMPAGRWKTPGRTLPLGVLSGISSSSTCFL